MRSKPTLPSGQQRGNSSPNSQIPAPAHHRLITDEDRVGWAMERYGPLNRGGRAKKVKEIAEAHKRMANIVNRAISKAFKDGLVEFREKPKSLAIVPRDDQVEKALEARFGFTAIAPMVGELHRLEASKQTDRILHCLGCSLARFLVDTPLLFRRGDVWGVGSGASLYYLVAALQELQQLRADGITIASVTGALHASNAAGDLAAVCDGDFHAMLFALRVVGKLAEVPRLMRTTLACPAERRDSMLHSTWLGEWSKSPVSHLICGTGVLSGGHRLHLELRPRIEEERKKQEAGLEPVADDLRKLSQISDELSAPSYYPVGDICNFLFYIEDPRAAARADEIRKLVDSINRRLLTVQEKELFEVENILLIAGSEKKRCALAQLLGPDPFRRGKGNEQKRLKIRCLCTDQETGKWLLESSDATLGH